MNEMLTDAKARVRQSVDGMDAMLRDLALRIHANPELSSHEFQAVQWLTAPLKEAGFAVETGVGGLPTSFRAVWEGQPGGPTVALLGEYDALPVVGHGCGHNLIGTAAVGAALALQAAVPDLKGRILVIGCPEEEKGAGKVQLDREGVFADVDAAMLCHPSRRTMILRGALACVSVTFRFYGKAAHAAVAPEKGISALDALIQSYNAISAMRQFLRDGNRIHGIISHGGDAPNVVPDYCEAKFLVRSPTMIELNEVKEKVYQAVRGATAAMGARVEIEEGVAYPERNNNVALAQLFGANLEAIGVEVTEPFSRGGVGSSDISVVGHRTATIHPYVKIAPEGVANHTAEFREYAASETGMQGLNQAAKALAMTALDLCLNSEALKAVREEFALWKAGQKASAV